MRFFSSRPLKLAIDRRWTPNRVVQQAFILGAGLGTRLRPLTARLPKPLIPLFHKSLAERALDTCEAVGVERFAINVHHLPEMWRDETFGIPNGEWTEPGLKGANGLLAEFGHWHDRPVHLFEEPDLLETGGGLKNLAHWIEDGPLLIHNGDIFSTMPLDRLLAAHAASGLPVTLALRSQGDATHIALDDSGERVIDIRNKLGRADGTHVFSGIYCVNREFLDFLPPGEKVSVIPAFLELAEQGRLGAITLDEGYWMDLGDRESYLAAHRDLELGPRIHPDADVSPEAVVERSVVGPGAKIEAGAVVRNSVVWPNAIVCGDAVLDRCIVYSDRPVSGAHQDVDL
jgi:NDP-sugar pyrophosphorylase family protein